MEPESNEGYLEAGNPANRRGYAYTAVLPRSAMPARPDREVDMSDATSSYAAAGIEGSAPSRHSRSHYYDKSQHYQCKFNK